MVYPIGSDIRVTYGITLSIGGLVKGDTLVTVGGWETRPETGVGPFVFQTTLNGEVYPDAVAEVDWLTRGTDTTITGIPPNPFTNRRHKPLGIEVQCRSYSWSYAYAEDIVLFDIRITNIGLENITRAFVSLQVYPYVGFPVGYISSDDIGGFIMTNQPNPLCTHLDTVNTLSWADNDGDPIDGIFSEELYPGPGGQMVRSTTSIFGICFLNPTPQSKPESGGEFKLSYNWWWQDLVTGESWGPVERRTVVDSGGRFVGAPRDDRDEYHLMTNGELDYPVVMAAAIGNNSVKWLPPPQELAEDVADGGQDLAHRLSIGPFSLSPGSSRPIAFAVFGAERFHADPSNIANLPHNPTAFLANVDFSDLARNANWAQRIYDNPGVDTDNDGYAGEFRVCVLDSELVNGEWVYNQADTQWYKGDGVPDWRAAGPPTPPEIWLEPIKNGLTVRFNGQVTETSKDVLTRTVDFEGYRVYLGRDEREASYSLIASYDIEDYDKYVFDITSGTWSVRCQPFTLEELRCLYADSCGDTSFDPLFFTRVHPYVMGDSAFYFEKHERNVSTLGEATPITKRYPDMVDPRTLHPDSIPDTMYTDDGYLKFYEYEMTIENLLATVPYWVNVTAFDFGSPESGLEPLESSVTLQAKSGYPLHPLDAPVSGSDEVYVYPNPYRIDAEYRQRGYEGRTRQDRSDDRVRAIWFANLPPKCTIEIFTIDGDMVRRLEHDMAPSDPNHRHHRWDLINRNAQRIVSGLYYWVVETPGGQTQMGKLAIIR